MSTAKNCSLNDTVDYVIRTGSSVRLANKQPYEEPENRKRRGQDSSGPISRNLGLLSGFTLHLTSCMQTSCLNLIATRHSPLFPVLEAANRTKPGQIGIPILGRRRRHRRSSGGGAQLLLFAGAMAFTRQPAERRRSVAEAGDLLSLFYRHAVAEIL